MKICLRSDRIGVEINSVKYFLFPLLLGAALTAPAAETNSTAVVKIGTAEVDKHYEEMVTVTGKVAQVTFRPKVVFLNLDKPFPNSPFTAVIMKTNGYGDLKSLENKNVEVTGKVKEFKEKPEIVIASTNDLKVVEAAKP